MKCLNCGHDEVHHIEMSYQIDMLTKMCKCYKVVDDKPGIVAYVCPCILYKPDKITE